MPSFSSHLFHRLFPSAASRVRPENIIKCKYSRQATRKYCEANIQNIVGKLPNMTIFMIEIYDQNVRHKCPPPFWVGQTSLSLMMFVCLLIRSPSEGEARMSQEVPFCDRNVEASRVSRLLVLRQKLFVAAVQFCKNILNHKNYQKN